MKRNNKHPNRKREFLLNYLLELERLEKQRIQNEKRFSMDIGSVRAIYAIGTGFSQRVRGWFQTHNLGRYFNARVSRAQTP